MKIKLIKNKHYKFGFYLAKGEVRECFFKDGRHQVEANEKGSGVWLTLNRKDFEIL